MIGGVDRKGWLSGELEPPAPIGPTRARSLATPLQDPKNPLRPEVLMDVDGAHERSL